MHVCSLKPNISNFGCECRQWSHCFGLTAVCYVTSSILDSKLPKRSSIRNIIHWITWALCFDSFGYEIQTFIVSIWNISISVFSITCWYHNSFLLYLWPEVFYVWAEINWLIPQNKEVYIHTAGLRITPLPLVNRCIFLSAQDENKEEAIGYTVKQEQSIKGPHIQVTELWKPTILLFWDVTDNAINGEK